MTVIIIHGNGHSTQQDNWIPYLKRELEKLQITVVVPQFSDAYLARALWWLLFLQHDLHADDQTILVGHSSGTWAAM